MMNQNKIINHIFKKLLLEGFCNEEIINFLSLRFYFTNFNNYIYYLWLLATDKKQNHDNNQRFAIIIKDYLWTLIERYNLKNLDIDFLDNNQTLSNKELFLLNIKNYSNQQKFYLVDNHLIIFLDQNLVNFKNYQLLKLDENFNYESCQLLIHYLQKNHTKILVFKKHGINNCFIDYFKFIDIDLCYVNQQWNYYLILTLNHGFDSTKPLFDCINNANDFYFNSFKQNKKYLLETIEIEKTDNKNLLKQLKQQENIFMFYQHYINYLIINHQQKTLLNMMNKLATNKLLLNHYDHTKLIANHTVLTPFYLVLLTNSYDFIYLKETILSDYLNNIYVIYSEPSNIISYYNDNQVILTMNDNGYQSIFDNELNKQIFSTVQNNNLVYLFQKINDQTYLFKGFYLVNKLFLNEQNEPTFLMTEANTYHLLNHYLYLNNTFIDNGYENIFINNINKALLQEYNSQSQLVKVNKFDVKNEKLNSLLFKYQWIYQKCINNINELKILDYFELYNEFYFRINSNISLVQQEDFIKALELKIINPFLLWNHLCKTKQKKVAKIFNQNEQLDQEFWIEEIKKILKTSS